MPTIRWRIEAIGRTIDALRALAPISQAVILKPPRLAKIELSAEQPRALIERLIDAYGLSLPSGEKIAQCAYCRDTTGRIAADHIFPKSRGGTDAWPNRVLSCARCNALKGDRTPEEAGMPLMIIPSQKHLPRRHKPYTSETAAGLLQHLRSSGITSLWLTAETAPPRSDISKEAWAAMQLLAKGSQQDVARYIAKPLSRPTKQRYTARNYSPHDVRGPGFTQVGTTVKRLTRVNRALIRRQIGSRTHVRLARIDEPVPDGADQQIRLGMLCHSVRAGIDVVGIVQALHSDGRVTLITPSDASAQGIRWKRVVVGTRRAFRRISTDRVLFLPDAEVHDGAQR